MTGKKTTKLLRLSTTLGGDTTIELSGLLTGGKTRRMARRRKTSGQCVDAENSWVCAEQQKKLAEHNDILLIPMAPSGFDP